MPAEGANTEELYDPLRSAIHKNDVAEIERLVENKGADVNYSPADNPAPLTVAMMCSRPLS